MRLKWLAKAREIFVNDNIDIVKAKKFLAVKNLSWYCMNKMTTLKKGTLKDILVGDADVKDTFNKVIDDFINYKGEAEQVVILVLANLL